MQTCGGIFSLLLKDRQTKLAQHLVAYTHCMYILSILQKELELGIFDGLITPVCSYILSVV